MSLIAKIAEIGVLAIPSGLLAAGVAIESGNWGYGAAVMAAFVCGILSEQSACRVRARKNNGK